MHRSHMPLSSSANTTLTVQGNKETIIASPALNRELSWFIVHKVVKTITELHHQLPKRDKICKGT